MAKKPKAETAAGNFRLRVSLTLVLIGTLLVGIFTYVTVAGSAQKEPSMLIISKLIVSAAENTSVPAPVDPKTGDIYFPQAKLYLPAQTDHAVQLTYQYSPEGWTEGDGPTLAISSKGVLNQAASKIYSSTSSNEVFTYVPKLQACQRGIHFEYKVHGEGDKPIHTIRLNNGKDLYMYTESACPELSEITDLLKNIQSY